MTDFENQAVKDTFHHFIKDIPANSPFPAYKINTFSTVAMFLSDDKLMLCRHAKRNDSYNSAEEILAAKQKSYF